VDGSLVPASRTNGRAGILLGKEAFVSHVKAIDLQKMAPLRNVSQKISQFLHKQISAYLVPFTPLLDPHRILGEFMESTVKERVPNSEKNFAFVEEQYKIISREPFAIPPRLTAPVATIKSKLELYPFEMLYALGDDAPQTISISSPVKWVLSYSSTVNLPRLIEAKLGGTKPEHNDLRHFLVASLVMYLAMDRSASIKQILEDLRFPVSVEKSPVTGELPLVVVSTPVPSFRPQDELISMVIQLSGKSAFAELIDVDEIDAIRDPFKDRIKDLAV
jgi:hypothetical protein